MKRIIKEGLLILVGIIGISLYEFIYNGGTVDFYKILKRSFIFAIIGCIIIVVYELIKYFLKHKEREENWGYDKKYCKNYFMLHNSISHLLFTNTLRRT